MSDVRFGLSRNYTEPPYCNKAGQTLITVLSRQVRELEQTLESQRAELEAAREVVGRTRTMLSTMTIADENDIFNKHRVKKAIEAYDAVRNQQTTSGEDDSDDSRTVSPIRT